MSKCKIGFSHSVDDNFSSKLPVSGGEANVIGFMLNFNTDEKATLMGLFKR